MIKRLVLGSTVLVLSALLAATPLAAQGPNPNYDPHVANPANPRIYFDTAHNNPDTLGGNYTGFRDLATADGYVVEEFPYGFESSEFDTILQENTARVGNGGLSDILMIVHACPSPCTLANTAFALTSGEADNVESWVKSGGSLFLVFEHPPFNKVLNLGLKLGFYPLAESVISPNSHTLGATSTVAAGPPNGVAVSSLENPVPESSGFFPISGATPVVSYGPPPETMSASGGSLVGMLQVAEYHDVGTGNGRMFVSAEGSYFTAQHQLINTPTGLTEGDNEQFLLNLLDWLAQRY